MLRRAVKDALKSRFPILVRLRDRIAPPPPEPEPEPGPAAVAEPVRPNLPTPAPQPTARNRPASGITREAVQAILDDMVRPALQSDGGDITLVKVENDDVYVSLVGACQTCPSSVVTMRMGVEALLQEELPGIGRIIQVEPGLA